MTLITDMGLPDEVVEAATKIYLKSVNELKVRSIEQEAEPLEDTLFGDCREAISAAIRAALQAMVDCGMAEHVGRMYHKRWLCGPFIIIYLDANEKAGDEPPGNWEDQDYADAAQKGRT